MGHSRAYFIFAFLINLYCAWYIATKWVLWTNKQKSRENWIFSQGARPTALKFSEPMQHLWSLISHPGLLGIWIQRTELLPRKGRATPTFRESKRSVLAHIKEYPLNSEHTEHRTFGENREEKIYKKIIKKSRRVNHIRPPLLIASRCRLSCMPCE